MQKTTLIGRHPLLCRWWCRSRAIDGETCLIKQGDENWEKMPLMEFYVPWWAWLFEILHRCVFGRVKIQQESENIE